MRRLRIAILAVGLLGAEEVHSGRLLGASRGICESVGGKLAATDGRYVTRACYWLDNCGEWATPSAWRDRLALGDSISKVVFWLSRPVRIDGDRYFLAVRQGRRRADVFGNSSRCEAYRIGSRMTGRTTFSPWINGPPTHGAGIGNASWTALRTRRSRFDLV